MKHWCWKWTIDIEDIKVQPKQRTGTGKNRPRVTRSGKISTSHRYTPKKTRDSMEALKTEYMIFMVGKKPIPAGVRIRLTFSLWTRKKWKPRKKSGDIDNCYKTITDAAKGMLWHDDNQITAWGQCNIHYGCEKENLLIGIETLEEK